MCDKQSYRSGHEEVPKPRTAEELLALRNQQQALREQKSKANGNAWQEDHLR